MSLLATDAKVSISSHIIPYYTLHQTMYIKNYIADYVHLLSYEFKIHIPNITQDHTHMHTPTPTHTHTHIITYDVCVCIRDFMIHKVPYGLPHRMYAQQWQ